MTSTAHGSAGMRVDAEGRVDPVAFRAALGLYASGVTIVTGLDASGPLGFTCQSFWSVSLEPPLVGISVMRTSTTYPKIQDTGRFAVNVLGHEQRALSGQFARSGTDKWSGVAWSTTAQSDPVIEGSLLWVDCRLHAEYDAGDHIIALGRVVEFGRSEHHAPSPLVFFGGGYRRVLEPVSDARGSTSRGA